MYFNKNDHAWSANGDGGREVPPPAHPPSRIPFGGPPDHCRLYLYHLQMAEMHKRHYEHHYQLAAYHYRMHRAQRPSHPLPEMPQPPGRPAPPHRPHATTQPGHTVSLESELTMDET